MTTILTIGNTNKLEHMPAFRSFIIFLAVGTALNLAVFWFCLIGGTILLKYFPMSQTSWQLLLLCLLYLSSLISGVLLATRKSVVKGPLLAPLASAVACVVSFFIYRLFDDRLPTDLPAFIKYGVVPVILLSLAGFQIATLLQKPDHSMEPVNNQNKWFRFRLGTLFFLIATAGLAFSWFAGNIQESWQLRHLRAFKPHPVSVDGDVYYLIFNSPDALGDDDLVHVAKLTEMRQLSLDFSNVSDKGLQQLEPLTQLELLGLRGTKVTDKGVTRLQRLLPECEIGY